MPRATFWVLVLNALLVGGLLALARWLQAPLLGQAIGAIVLLYVVTVPIVGWLRGQHELLDAWLFLLPLSMCQVVPDWILVEQLHVLSFPPLGGGHFGPVPQYMAGLWIAPLMLVIWIGEVVHRRSAAVALVAVAVGSAAIFGAAEWIAPRLLLWFPHGVRTWHGVAIYVVAAEVLLSVATWLVFLQVQGRTIFAKAFGAAGVSIFYAGALVVSNFLVERLA